MQTHLFAKTLRGKKDVVAFRERARQTARLLRFGPVEQATIAAAAFVVAYQALGELIRPRLVIGLDQDNLRIEAQGKSVKEAPLRAALPGGSPLYHFVKPLPTALELAAPDLAWIIAQVHQPRAADLYEEIHQQNQELLALAHALQERERELAQVRANVSAA